MTIAFPSNHIDTLHELDIECGELAQHAGITNDVRAPAMNGMPRFQDALAEIVADHLMSGEACTKQYGRLSGAQASGGPSRASGRCEAAIPARSRASAAGYARGHAPLRTPS